MLGVGHWDIFSISEQINAKRFETSNRIVKTTNEKKLCFYQKALYATLCTLKPKICIEIGTHTGGTTQVFQQYFDDNNLSDGLLLTCDIKKYVDLSHLKNVKQLIVSHHVENIQSFHRVHKNELLFDELSAKISEIDKDFF